MLFYGTEVRIADDERAWVLVPASPTGGNARWRPITLAEITLDAQYPDQLITPYARHCIGDLGVSLPQLSQTLGLPRRDPQRVHDLWHSPQYLRGSTLAIDFDNKELAPAPDLSDPPDLVYPFSAFAALTLAGEPRLVQRIHRPPTSGPLPLGDHPIPPEALARILNIPLRP